MTDYNDGNWHGWQGGDCPVHPKSMVEWVSTEELRKWKLDKVDPENASYLDWFCIIGFRVTKPYVEAPKPRELWLNEYSGGANAVHFNEESAVRIRGNDAKTTRWIEALE